MSTETTTDIHSIGICADLVIKYTSKLCPFCGASKYIRFFENNHVYGRCNSPTCHDGKIGWRIN